MMFDDYVVPGETSSKQKHAAVKSDILNSKAMDGACPSGSRQQTSFPTLDPDLIFSMSPLNFKCA